MTVEPPIILRERVRHEKILLILRKMVHFVVRVQIVPPDLAVFRRRAMARIAPARDRFIHRLRFRPVFVVPHIRVLHIVAETAGRIRRVSSRIVRSCVKPQTDDLLFLFRHLHSLMAALDQTQKLAVSRSDLVRIEIALRTVPIVAEHFPPRHMMVAERIERIPMPRAVKSSLLTVRIMALDAMFVQDRLNVARKTENIRHARDFFRENRRRAHDLGNAFPFVRARRLRPLFMAADADGIFARHDGRERVHPLHAVSFFIDRDKKKRSARRQIEVRTPVLRHRNAAVETLDRKRSERGDLLHSSGIVDRLRKRFVNEEFLHRSRFQILHFPPFVEIHQSQRPVVLRRVGLVGDEAFTLTLHERARFADPESLGRETRAGDRGIHLNDLARFDPVKEFRRESKERLLLSLAIDQNQPFV